jgi:glutathione S-transferase
MRFYGFKDEEKPWVTKMKKRLKWLNEELAEKSYLHGDGFACGPADCCAFKELNAMDKSSVCCKNYPHLKRWFTVMSK